MPIGIIITRGSARDAIERVFALNLLHKLSSAETIKI